MISRFKHAILAWCLVLVCLIVVSCDNKKGGEYKYMVVNLDTGKVRYTNDEPDLSSNICRREELWLHWIPAGTFTMGSPEDELGRDDDELQHEVTLTSGYWMGIFEVTQRQWSLLMGDNPSYDKGDTRPVEEVSYFMIRGEEEATWPTCGHEVGADSFLGQLRSFTGLAFDLPTEAQWEYACRAGTTTAQNVSLDDDDAESRIIKERLPEKRLTKEEVNLAKLGRYTLNSKRLVSSLAFNPYAPSDGKGGYEEHTTVGSYMSNNWSLFDMHGNVSEWCLDWYGRYSKAAVKDPVGAESVSKRVVRGGGWNSDASSCRSAARRTEDPSSTSYDIGFRVVVNP